MSESNPKSPRNTPSDLVGVGVPISRNVQDSQSDPEILPDVASSPKPATLGTRYSSRMRQPPRGLADFVITPRSMAAKRKAERRAKQSHDQKQIRLGHQASYQSKYRALETPEQKAALAEAKTHHRAQETPEQLAIRLGKQAVFQSEYRVAETPEPLVNENLKRRSPFIFFYVGWEVPRGVLFVINLVRFRYGVRPVS